MKSNNFQIILIVIFIALAGFGVLVFSGFLPIGKQKVPPGSLGTVTLWGTVRSDDIAPILEIFNEENPAFTLRYIPKSVETFDMELLEALASGQGPDLFFLSNELVYSYSNKILTIPYESYPRSNFTANFASAGEVFMTSNGLLALPLAIDPLMMYYNRSILNKNNIVFPPEYWDQFTDLIHTVTKRDESRQLLESAVALGQFVNVKNAKGIISTLFMQAGNKIIEPKEHGLYKSVLTDTSGLNDMLAFYTSFADPLNDNYSWNRALPNSQDFFSSEDLAFYFGYASELGTLINKNPNQDFLVAPVPQIRNSDSKLTHAKVLGIAISQFSKNRDTAILAANLIAGGDFADSVAKELFLAPARRDLLVKKHTDSFLPYFYSSALFAKSWVDPDPNGSNNVFRNAVEGILSNRIRPESAITDMNGKLQFLLAK